MSAKEAAGRLLAELLAAGGIPVIERGRLRIAAPPGVLTPARREALARCRADLRALVEASWRSREECIAPRPCRRMSGCARPVEGRPCLVPATCCVCGAPLPSRRRYLCAACADSGERR